jgi:hypothetical protein
MMGGPEDEQPGWIVALGAALTGLKMLLILSLRTACRSASSPSSPRSTMPRQSLEGRSRGAGARLVHAQRLTIALTCSFTIRAARTRSSRRIPGICKRTLDRLGRSPNTRPLRFVRPIARPLCERGLHAAAGAAPPPGGPPAFIMPGGNVLEIFMYDPDGGIEGVPNIAAKRSLLWSTRRRRRAISRWEAGPGQQGMPLRAAANRPASLRWSPTIRSAAIFT